MAVLPVDAFQVRYARSGYGERRAGEVSGSRRRWSLAEAAEEGGGGGGGGGVVAAEAEEAGGGGGAEEAVAEEAGAEAVAAAARWRWRRAAELDVHRGARRRHRSWS
jgi:hypothetical protein